MLNYTLLKHSLCNLHEAGDISSFHIVYITIRLGSVFNTSLVDIRHDCMEFLINFCRAPADMQAMHYVKNERQVKKGDVVKMKMVRNGGYAAVLK